MQQIKSVTASFVRHIWRTALSFYGSHLMLQNKKAADPAESAAVEWDRM
jgi:hypothetical protein